MSILTLRVVYDDELAEDPPWRDVVAVGMPTCAGAPDVAATWNLYTPELWAQLRAGHVPDRLASLCARAALFELFAAGECVGVVPANPGETLAHTSAAIVELLAGVVPTVR